MFKTKTHNKEYGSFLITNSGYKKYKNYFIIAVFGLIFITGFGLILFRHIHKAPKIAKTQQTQNVAGPIPGWWYQQYFGSSVCIPTSKDWSKCQPNADPDNDGLTNAQEFYYQTDPLNAHTVGDKLNDGQLVAAGFDPSKKDRMTFTQAASDDEIVGESLAYGSDTKTMIEQITDTSTASVPDVSKIPILTSNNNSKQTILNYFNQTSSIYSKYLPGNIDITTIISSRDSAGVADLITRTNEMMNAFELLTVPTDAVQIQQYQLALLETIPLIVNVPSVAQLSDDTDTTSNAWFDNAKSYSLLVQKISLESAALTKKYNITNVNADQ